MSDVNPTVDVPIVPRTPGTREVELPNFTIVVESGPDAGNRFGPLKEQTKIGRKIFCDIGLTDPKVSAEHCELVWTQRGLRIRDLGSKNGIWCKGIQLHDAVLPTPCGFRLGDSTLRVEMAGGTHKDLYSPIHPSLTMVGQCTAMRHLFATMERVAETDMAVLLLGETGTGKTAIARTIHKMSSRATGEFVVANCAAIPGELMESTFFGHTKDAFTGAHKNKPGLFEQANGGSLFLDEIGELPLAMQAKLLSVLDRDQRVRPLGAEAELQLDFRLFCATNRDLTVEMAAGRFREDLYYRIAGMMLTVPPLRKRHGDLGVLCEWLTVRACNELRAKNKKFTATSVSPEALYVLQNHWWPGNVRELAIVLARAVAVSITPEIMPEDILFTPWSAAYDEVAPPEPGSAEQSAAASDGAVPTFWDAVAGKVRTFKAFKAALLGIFEKAYFRDALAHFGRNVKKTAEQCDISRTYLNMMIKKYEL